MDLITTGHDGPLSNEEEKEIRNGSNSIEKEYKSRLNFKILENDWEHQAFKSFNRIKILEKIWRYLSDDQRVKESHYFYDCIFRCKNKSKYIDKDIYNTRGPRGGITNGTDDHPFSARIVMRILCSDNINITNDYNYYKQEFYKLTQTLKISKKKNQEVKYKSDNQGEIKLNVLLKERYSDMIFINIDTGEEIRGFPLKIPQWYYDGELRRLKD